MKMIEKTDRKSPAGGLGGGEQHGEKPLFCFDCTRPPTDVQYIFEPLHLADTYQARAKYWAGCAMIAEAMAELEELGESLGGDDGA